MLKWQTNSSGTSAGTLAHVAHDELVRRVWEFFYRREKERGAETMNEKRKKKKLELIEETRFS